MRIDLYKIPLYQDQTRPFPLKLTVNSDCIVFLPEKSQVSANLHQKQIRVVYLSQNLMKALIKKVIEKTRPKGIKSQSIFEKSLRTFQEILLKSKKKLEEFRSTSKARNEAFRSLMDRIEQFLDDFNNEIKRPTAVNHNDAIVMSIARHTNIIVQENLKTARWFKTVLKVIQSTFFFFKDTLFSLVR